MSSAGKLLPVDKSVHGIRERSKCKQRNRTDGYCDSRIIFRMRTFRVSCCCARRDAPRRNVHGIRTLRVLLRTVIRSHLILSWEYSGGRWDDFAACRRRRLVALLRVACATTMSCASASMTSADYRHTYINIRVYSIQFSRLLSNRFTVWFFFVSSPSIAFLACVSACAFR